MSEHAKSARAAMKAKAKRLGSAGDPKARVDASSWTPPEMVNAGAKTGMRPISPRAYKRGGKVMHVEGEKAHHHAGRKPRKDGGKTEMPLVDRFINADRKKANLYREGGDAHVGGYKHGGAPKHKMGGGGLYGLSVGRNNFGEKIANRFKSGGATEHDDEAADRALVKKMVKGSALTGKKRGGEAGEKWIAGAIKHPGALHKALHVPEGKKIPAKKLEKAAHSDNPKLAKRANLAKTLKRMHKADGGFSMDDTPPGEALYRDVPSRAPYVAPGSLTFRKQETLNPSSAPFLDREKRVKSELGPLPRRAHGGKAEHGAGCRCHKCMGGRMGKAEGGSSEAKSPSMYHVVDRHTGNVVGKFKSAAAASSFRDKKDAAHGASRYSRMPVYEDDVASRAEGGKVGDVGGERPKGGRVARATGGRAKGKTNVNIIISAGQRPGADGMMTPPGMPTPPPGAAPAVMPRQAPVMPPPAAPMPMPMPPGGGGMPMPPPGAPMGRKAGGRVYRSYKDMDAGAGSGLGRLEKTEIEGRK